MPIKIAWHNPEKTILMITFEGDWELYDYQEMLKISRSMTSAISHDFITIVDMRASSAPPSKLLSMGDQMEQIEGTHLPIQNILIGMGRFLEMMFGVMKRIYPRGVKDTTAVSTLEEGLRIAEDHLSKAENKPSHDQS